MHEDNTLLIPEFLNEIMVFPLLPTPSVPEGRPRLAAGVLLRRLAQQPGRPALPLLLWLQNV